MLVTNPILPGFHPDPSIVRVGNDYYIANSTFEWFGGVEIHHSKNLKDWHFVCRPLSTQEHLAMRGNPSSGGIWAPCLTHHDGLFWLIFTDVKSWNDGPYKDCHNYVTTAPSIEGPWSRPVYLNSSGFDASLFHDDDGRSWYLNMEWDYRRPGLETFSGILLQEFDRRTKTLLGGEQKIFLGTTIGLVEGPHLYKRGGWYYLVTAEGGTMYEHAVTVARSRHITGPYEVHPQNPLISSHGKPELYLQKAGHGSWTSTPDGRWYLAFLVGRPLQGTEFCPLGRETALAELTWKDDWPWVLPEAGQPAKVVDVPAVSQDLRAMEPDLPWAGPGQKRQYTMGSPLFFADFMTLRNPMDRDIFDFTRNPGSLTITGQESMVSRFDQSIVCRRQTDFSFRAETSLSFVPKSYHHMAGLLYRYDENNQFYCRLAWNPEKKAPSLGILVMNAGVFSMPLGDREVIIPSSKVYLSLHMDNRYGYFSWSLDGKAWTPIEYQVDSTIVSDEYHTLGFTGAFVGMACQDMLTKQARAEFHGFTYEGLDGK